VLGVTPLRVGQEAYWLEQIARDRCEYYAGKGESPGWWLGSCAKGAGLEGVASEEAVHRLFAGQAPLTGERRVAPVWRSDPRSKLPAGPLQELAATRGVDVGELAMNQRERRGGRCCPRSGRSSRSVRSAGRQVAAQHLDDRGVVSAAESCATAGEV
jgi:hypothetical protein